MIKSSTIKRIASAACAAIFLVAFSIPAFAVDDTSGTDYKATVYLWNLANANEEYGGTVDGVLIQGATGRATASTGGTITSVPLNLNDDFNRFYFGAVFPTNLNNYDNSATFKMVVTITLGVTGSYSGTAVPLYGSTYKTTQIRNTGRSVVSNNCDFTTASSNTYTFSYDNIPYDNVLGFSFFYIDLRLSQLASTDSNSLYVVNSYFGLSSYYDDDLYKAATMNKLDDINSALQEQNNKLDNIEGSVDEVGNKVDQAADQISGDLDELQQSIQNQPQEEMDIADQKGSEASGEADSALNDSGLTPELGNLWAGLKTIFNSISTTETISYIPIPEIKLPSLTSSIGNTPELTLVPSQNYDISELLQKEPIQKLISASKVLYYIFFAIFIVDYCRKLLAKIGLGDVNTNDNSPAKTDSVHKDSHSSRSDRHGVKWR